MILEDNLSKLDAALSNIDFKKWMMSTNNWNGNTTEWRNTALTTKDSSKDEKP
jgi:hypothetical protein